MSIVSVNEIWEPRTATLDEFGVRQYERSWRIFVSDHNDDPLQATATGALPPMFSPYEASNGAKDNGASLRFYTATQQIENPHEYRVTAKYTNARSQSPSSDNPFDYHTPGSNTTGNASELNPLLRAPEIQWGSLHTQRPIYRSKPSPQFPKGAGITASNGQMFAQHPMLDRSMIALSISRNEATFSVNLPMTYQDKVNDGVWSLVGKLAGTTIGDQLAKCVSITAQSQIEQKKFFWRVSYVFHINPFVFSIIDNVKEYEKWDEIRMDTGTYELKAGFNNPQYVADKILKVPITQPFALDGAGGKLDAVKVKAGDFIYGKFPVYEKISFNALNLA